MKQLVIGNKGQIGSALQKVLGCSGHDKEQLFSPNAFDVIHITIPWSDQFIQAIQSYQNIYSPTLTIIHSTVPIGTSYKLGATHSPVRGVHPNLEEGIRTFVKFFGGEQSELAAKIFKNLGIKTYCTPNASDTEAMKLLSTEQYRTAILEEKRIHDFCQQHNLDFDVVYTRSNQTYNEGYKELGMPQYSRYALKHVDGPIGGHCVNPNHEILVKHHGIEK